MLGNEIGVWHLGNRETRLRNGTGGELRWRAVFPGEHPVLEVDGREIDVTGWRGSQNHNWGTKHTDRYAWAQCNVFEGAPDTYMEMMSARLKIGPVWTPRFPEEFRRYRGYDMMPYLPAELLNLVNYFVRNVCHQPTSPQLRIPATRQHKHDTKQDYTS